MAHDIDNASSTRLPVELLVEIFAHNIDSLSNPPYHGQKDSLDKQPRNQRPFQLTLSHVCSRWRSTTLCFHPFWASVVLSRDLEKPAAFIDRSGDSPLDITLDMSSFMRSLHENSWRAFDFDFCQAEKLFDQATNHLASVMALILPHHKRWRSFAIIFSVSEHLERVLAELGDVDGAPLLERISFISSVDKGHFDTIHPLKTKAPLKLFRGETPRLGNLTLESTSLHWSILSSIGQSPSTLFRPITSLCLKNLRLFTYSSFAHFTTLIRSSPTLSELSIEMDDLSCATLDRSWWSKPLSESETNYTTESIVSSTGYKFVANLPALRRLSLSLRFGEGTEYSNILRGLCAPGLQSLRLDLRVSHSSIEDHEAGAEELNDFVRVMCSPFLDRSSDYYSLNSEDPHGRSRPGILSNVQHLEIQGSDLTSVEITQLTYSLTQLRSLKIDQRKCVTNVLSSFAAQSVSSDPHSAPCPFLERVDVVLASPVVHKHSLSGFSDMILEDGHISRNSLMAAHGPLADLVRNRAARGTPLQRLFIDGQDVQIATMLS